MVDCYLRFGLAVYYLRAGAHRSRLNPKATDEKTLELGTVLARISIPELRFLWTVHCTRDIGCSDIATCARSAGGSLNAKSSTSSMVLA